MVAEDGPAGVAVACVRLVGGVWAVGAALVIGVVAAECSFCTWAF